MCKHSLGASLLKRKEMGEEYMNWVRNGGRGAR